MARLMLANNELDDSNTEFIELPTTDIYAALSAGESGRRLFRHVTRGRDRHRHAERSIVGIDESSTSRRL